MLPAVGLWLHEAEGGGPASVAKVTVPSMRADPPPAVSVTVMLQLDVWPTERVGGLQDTVVDVLRSPAEVGGTAIVIVGAAVGADVAVGRGVEVAIGVGVAAAAGGA